MTASLSQLLDDLRAALLKLRPTGPVGFEGLLAHVLSKTSGQEFRLAKSGLQLGKDGESLAQQNRIAFEAKLYTGDISDKEVHGKITQIIGGSTPPDVWILGATVEASTQLLEPMESAARKNGIAILVLDWPSSSPIPPLAVVCAMAPDETIAFLKEHLSDATLVAKAETALAHIRDADDFEAHAANLRKALAEPTLGVAAARAANRHWLEAAFSDRRIARDVFGQVLAPRAGGALPLHPRADLVTSVQKLMTAVPSGEIIALIGGDGYGKSWLFAQSWLSLQESPLTVLIPATDLKPFAIHGNLLPFLIARLIQQTGDSDSEQTRKRWERRFAYWKELPNGSSPRFIVCVDGLNQQKGVNWSRWLDGAAAVIQQHGGTLVVTVRQAYYHDSLRTALNSKVKLIRVPEWAHEELIEILSFERIEHTQINPAVLTRLRNPRILGIAFELRDNLQIQSFTELSVERLLFEHIRIGHRDGTPPEAPDEFVKRLAEHAQQIIDRVHEQKHEDRMVFDLAREGSQGHELTAELAAVAGELFFRSLPEDPTLYTLTKDGLSLALGLSLIRALQKAARSSRDVSEALDELLEPIAALDKTADAVFAAVLVSSIDERCSPELRRALICGLLRLQNIEGGTYAAFVSVVRNMTDAAMNALVDLSVTSRYTGHKDWLSSALLDCRHAPECWAEIAKHISEWLRAYSLDPTIGMMSTLAHDSADKVAKEEEKNAKKLEKNLADLSVAEREFLNNRMVRRDTPEPAVLAEEAIALLAGMPLAPFADDLIACCFSMHLNFSVHGPYDEFIALLRFNRNDWSEMRVALLDAASFLQEQNTSRTGRWAMVAVSRGLSTEEDAAREERLIDELTKDREKPRGGRLVEKYCATDPCDPSAQCPGNIEETARRCSAINVEGISRHRSMGSDDHFVRDARPGLARFVPDVAIAVQRKIAESVVLREPDDLMLGVASLEVHSAVLSSETVAKLVEIARSLSSPRKPDSTREERERWVSAQYAIQAAFPHLDGNGQLDVLLSLPPHGPPLLKLADVLKPADSAKLELALQRAWASRDHCRQLAALLFARRSDTELTTRSFSLVGELARHERSSVRAEAMSVIAHERDESLIKALVESGWSASALDRCEHHFEIWQGSLAMIHAAKLELLSPEQVLDRITPELYGHAAHVLGSDIHAAVAARLRSAVSIALDVTLPFAPPLIEQAVGGDPSKPSMLALAEPDEVLGPEAFFKRLNETPEDAEARQRQGQEAFNRFQAELTKDNAHLIIEDVGFRAIETFVSASPSQASKLVESLLDAEARKLRHVHNFALMLAERISRQDSTLARRLFDRLRGGRPFVRLTYGYSSVPLEAVCVWGSADSPEMDQLRARRLDGAPTDYHIAQEVRAALMRGKTAFLERYVRDNLEKPEPAAKARALMVVGFGLESPEADVILVRYSGTGALLGAANKAARFAYDRNRWTRYWFERMCQTDSAEEFWCLSALFLKIADDRFSHWEADIPRSGAAIQKFAPSIQAKFEHRVKAWKAKREKTLCGDKAPNELFVLLD